ncbi:MAG: methyltransferase domain-containing protein [Halomonas sp.]|uniref:methyltransferase domain-containing protein n=1 Tax=Halomonas sp. TaxID=1486246 RepID=UPI003F904BAE
MSAPASPLSSAGDRHFDGLAEKFAKSLYGGPRGHLRLALLDRLLPEMLDLHGQPVLDVGGGLGQMSEWLAKRGHAVTLSEPSGEMLAIARERLAAFPVTFHQQPLQAFGEVAPGPWPLVVCHAVLEWVADPRAAFEVLTNLLAPGGQLSLMVFNRDALRFSNAVKGNLRKVLDDRLAGRGLRQRLTPISPLTHAEVTQWAEVCGLRLTAVAGVRIFHDYLRRPTETQQGHDDLLEIEWRYCRVDPHWRLGRYLLYTFERDEARNAPIGSLRESDQ